MEERIKRTISDVFGVSAASVGNDSSQDTIEQWDSLGHMNLCVALEEEFGVRFTDRQVIAMVSYDAIVRTLAEIRVPGAAARTAG